MRLKNQRAWALCLALTLWACDDDGGEASVADAQVGPGPSTLCGDGLRQSPEQCDDGNTIDGDGCSATCTHEAPPEQTIKINEVVAKAADGGPDWIELYNPTMASVEIGGWALSDASGEAWTIPEGARLDPIGFIVFEKDADFTFGLGGADAVHLLDPTGAQVDATDWDETRAPEGFSWGRLPDGIGAFQTLNLPTPGAPNALGDPTDPACGDGRLDVGEACDDGNTDPGDGCDAECQVERPEGVCGDGVLNAGEACDDNNTDPGDGCDADCQLEEITSEGLVINEVMPVDAAGGPDWIELYNGGAVEISLGGWTLTDSDPAHEIALPVGLIVPADGYLLLTRDVDFNFGLGRDDSLLLRTPAGARVDETAWVGAEDGLTWGRIPNGEGDFKWLAAPTPEAANVDNEAPIDPVCGDGERQAGEACDDGNTDPGDGCDADCQLEEVPQPVCGDGALDAGEACDDGNTDPGDGCDADCRLEAAAAVVINEVMAADAAGGPDWIELYNLESEAVSLEGWSVGDDDPTHRAPLTGISVPAEGFLVLYRDEHFEFGLGGVDGVRLVAPDEALIDSTDWIDGAAPEGTTWGRLPDGTGAFGTLEPTPGAPNRARGAPGEPVCGDGVVEGDEECDDGNTDAGDGCDSGCERESAPIDPICGNGEVESGEACDDGNTDPGDGCDAQCRVEDDPVCGDGVMEGDEACDDGNADPGDGCDAQCQIEEPDPSPRIAINEVMAADAAGGPDWIELYNLDDLEADLTGWSISDDDPAHFTALDGLTIPARGYLVLTRGVEFEFGLGGADGIQLADPSDAIVDGAAWEDGQAPEGTTWGRLPDGEGDFRTLYEPTPSAANRAGEPPVEVVCGDGVVGGDEACDDGNTDPGDGCDAACAFEPSILTINEVVAMGADGGPDWLELYHHGLRPLDVSGFSVLDDDPTHDAWAFPEGTILAPMSYVVLTRGVEFSFGLGAADGVRLYDAADTPIDSTDWTDGDAPEGSSWGRVPDGSGDFQTLSTVTPGAENVN